MDPVLDAGSQIPREPAEIQREPAEIQREPAEIQREPAEIQRRHGTVLFILARLLDPALHRILSPEFRISLSKADRRFFNMKRKLPYFAETLLPTREQHAQKHGHEAFTRRKGQDCTRFDLHAGWARTTADVPHGSNFLDEDHTDSDVWDAVDVLIDSERMPADVVAFMDELLGTVQIADPAKREDKAYEFAVQWFPDDLGPCPNCDRDPDTSTEAVRLTPELYYSYRVKGVRHRAPQHLAFYLLAALSLPDSAAAALHMLITLVPALLPSATSKIHHIREPLLRSVGLDLERGRDRSMRTLVNKLLTNKKRSVDVGKARLQRVLDAAEQIVGDLENRRCRLCERRAERRR